MCKCCVRARIMHLNQILGVPPPSVQVYVCVTNLENQNVLLVHFYLFTTVAAALDKRIVLFLSVQQIVTVKIQKLLYRSKDPLIPLPTHISSSAKMTSLHLKYKHDAVSPDCLQRLTSVVQVTFNKAPFFLRFAVSLY